MEFSSGTTLLKILWRGRATSAAAFLPLLSLLLLTPAAGCVGGHALIRHDTAEAGAVASVVDPSIAWYGPTVETDGTSLARWRHSVGPPVLPAAVSINTTRADKITVVSWNTHVGAADVLGFVRSLPDPQAPLVLMLQEVYRCGPEVPSRLDRGWSFAGHQGGAAAGARSQEIEAIAHTLGLSLYYVPSMRNGGAASNEDRGNAILSNLALTDLTAIELPFERQRRVAIGATIAGTTSGGSPWRVRIVNAHLDNTASGKHAWIAAEYSRARQARGLTSILHDDQPTILAGDFNTWFGFSDQAYVETARAFPDFRMSDRRATFLGLLRLDHVFLRLAPGWQGAFRRADSRFGSDHYPLVGTVQFR